MTESPSRAPYSHVDQGETSGSSTPSAAADTEQFSAFDLRMRSVDRRRGDPINMCSGCGGVASWSVWLHTPEWGPGNAGLTLVLCRACALDRVEKEARRVGA